MGGQGQERGWRQQGCHSSRTEVLEWLNTPCPAAPSLEAAGSVAMGTVVPPAASACHFWRLVPLSQRRPLARTGTEVVNSPLGESNLGISHLEEAGLSAATLQRVGGHKSL